MVGLIFALMLGTGASAATVQGSLLVTSTATVQGNAFSVGGATLVVSGGSVGIGTTSPATPLDVNGTSTLRGQVTVNASPSSGSAMTINQGGALATTGIQILNAATIGNNYGVDSEVTGSATQNVAGYFYATGAATNIAVDVVSGNVKLGNVGTPTGKILCLDASGYIGHCTSAASCIGTCTCTCAAN